MVYYRKYRPQNIDDLDNAHVRETLTSVLKKPTTHAFLFTGPKGLGKTSTARIIAKVVNCERRVSSVSKVSKVSKALDTPGTLDTPDTFSIEPCNTCEQCVSITNGTHMDVLEIDAASNRGIDEIRELKEKIRLAPVSAKQKVYIIDEVHMLTTEAFNALLKTLEEPPSHAMFILCTTEPHKVPQTIISRCTHFSFSLATTEELVRSFKRIVKGEKIDINDDALVMIAELADGGFRDGAKLLEEVVSIANGEKITKELIESKYQVSSIKHQVLRLLDAFIAKDTKAGLEIVQNLVEQGVDIKNFLQTLMGVLHTELLLQVGIKESEEAKKRKNLSVDEIKVLFEILSRAYADTKFAVLPQLPLELAIIEYCTEMVEEQNETPLRQDFEGHANGTAVAVQKKESGVTVSSLRKQVGTIKKIQALYGDKSKKDDEVKETITTTSVELMHASPNGEVTAEWMDHFWKQLIAEMKQYNHTVAGLLRGCKIASFDKKTLKIQTNYKFHKERLDDMKTRDALMKVAKLLTGKDVEVVVELKA